MLLVDIASESVTLVLEMVYSMYFYARSMLGSFFTSFWKYSYDFANRRYSNMTQSISFLNFGYKDGASYANSPIDDALKEKRDSLQKALPDSYKTFWCSAQLYAAVLSRYTGDLSKKFIMEVGCGRGGGCAVIHALCTPSKYIGIDLSPEAIQTCKDNNANDKNKEFLVGDSMKLYDLMPPKEVDVIVNVESSHCYPNLDLFIKGVTYCLKPDGQFLYADIYPAREWDNIRTVLTKNKMSIMQEYDITANVLRSLNDEVAPALHKMNLSSANSLAEKLVMWVVSNQTVNAPKRLMQSGIAQYRMLVCQKQKNQ